MKKLLTLATMILVVIASSCSYDDTGIWNSINNLEQRVLELEKTCKEMNTNISAMQAILTALQSNDYVTSVVQIEENGKTIGYTINFSKSGSITIYNGVNNKTGNTPVIGVKQDTDGIYYWTLDGKWLTDEDGNKIKAVGTDGTTPQLKIENDHWYISYDDGATWTKLSEVSDEDGDNLFSSVTFDDEYIYLTLADGSEIAVPLKDNSPLADLKSVVFVPRYSDCKAAITSDDYTVEFDFLVSPARLATVIAENYGSMLSVSAVETVTRASSLIDLPIISCAANDNGIISVVASCELLDFKNDHYAFLTISDGNNSITSERIELAKQDFIIEVTDIDTISAAIKVSCNGYTSTFAAGVIEYDGKSTATDVMYAFIDRYFGYCRPSYTDEWDWSGGPNSYGKYDNLTPDTEYAVIVFGYIGDVFATTKPYMVTFRTLPAPDASETVFEFSASSVTHNRFNIDITSSVPSTYYACGICTPEKYDQELFITEFEAEIAEIVAMQKDFDPYTTLAKVLSIYCYRGNISTYASGLQPATTYMGYIFAIDHKTGKVAKVHTFENLATTMDVAMLEVAEPIIVKNDTKYDIQFIVKTDDKAVDLLVGTQLYTTYDFETYWDPNDWSQIQAFFLFRNSVDADILAAAKTAEGGKVSITGVDKDDYVFFFEVLTAENIPTQYAIRVTPEMFE